MPGPQHTSPTLRPLTLPATAGRRVRRLPLTVAVVAVSLGLAGCGGADPTTDASAQPLTKVTFRMDFSAWGGEAPVFLAQAKGYYKDAGIDLEILPGKGSGNTAQSVFAGHDDLGHVLLPTAIMAIDQGAPGMVVGTMSNANGSGLFVGKDSGIKELKDLYGKTILAAPSAGSEYTLKGVFEANGLDLSKVTVQNTEVGSLNAVYGQRKVDAALQEIAYGNPMVQKVRPSDVIRFKDNGLNLVHYGIITNKMFISEHAAILPKFLAATQKGYDDAVKDPESAAKAVAAKADQLTQDQILDQWKQSIEIKDVPGAQGLPALCSTDAIWEGTLTLLSKYGGLKSDPKDVKKFFTQEYLKCDK